MTYAQFKVTGQTEDGKPQCTCPVCGQAQRVQPQQLVKRMVYQVECTKRECPNYLKTAYIAPDDIPDVIQ